MPISHLPYPREELYRQGPSAASAGARWARSSPRSAASALAPSRWAGAASCAIGRSSTGPAKA